jgi:hypothetical protein
MLDQQHEHDLPRSDPDRLERADLADLRGHAAGDEHRRGGHGEDPDQGPCREQGSGQDVDVGVRLAPALLPGLHIGDDRRGGGDRFE